jgi:hypothetical protein
MPFTWIVAYFEKFYLHFVWFQGSHSAIRPAQIIPFD